MAPNRLYHDNMYRFGEPEPSYWEATRCETRLMAEPLIREEQCEVAIIGGGYTGLSAAYHLCRDHQVDARVLEAGHIGWGASGRNGGFCSIGGSSLDMASMIRIYSLEETRKYYQSQVRGGRARKRHHPRRKHRFADAGRCRVGRGLYAESVRRT